MASWKGIQQLGQLVPKSTNRNSYHKLHVNICTDVPAHPFNSNCPKERVIHVMNAILMKEYRG